MSTLIFVFITGTTLLLLSGILADRLLSRQGALMQNACLRASFLAVLACPVVLTVVGVLQIRTYTVPVLPPLNMMDGSWGAVAKNLYPTEGAISNFALDVKAKPQSNLERNTDVAVTGRHFSLVHVLMGVWFAGIIVMLARLGIAYARVAGWRKQTWAASEQIQQKAALLAENVSLKAPVVCVSDVVSSPALIGLWNPAIVLPASNPNPTSEVLLHELGHLKRHDAWWQLAGHLTAALLFFHPLAWWTAWRQEERAEEVCDDWVVSQTENPGRYAMQLVDLAECQLCEKSLLTAGIPMASFRSALGRRVERMFDVSRVVRTRLGLLRLAGIGMVATAFVVMLGILRPVEAANEQQKEAAANKQSSPVADSKSPNIGEIELEYAGPRKPDKNFILEIMSMKKGGAYSIAAVARDIRKLYATGLFKNLRIYDEAMAGGVKVVVVLQPNPSIKSIQIKGAGSLAENDILDGAEAEIGSLYSDFAAYRDAKRIETTLHRMGISNPVVTHEIKDNEQLALADVTFTINR
ncbi:MAG: M56 family metallopeptidase [Methylacidiphilales bacterium]|nr:M56 family metallopeptidase [Candidatus Methylacidiphilales bacterium]